MSGHVDGLGKVISVEESKKSWNLEVRWIDPVYGRYICEKGSICIDGISLTIADCSGDGMNFSIAVIPHTWKATALQYLSTGDEVNLEADLMAKYAESLIRKSISGNKIPLATDISKAWLESHGWG